MGKLKYVDLSCALTGFVDYHLAAEGVGGGGVSGGAMVLG